MTASTTSPVPQWPLPEDGVIDEISVEITALGTRHAALTPGERSAAALILAWGGTPGQVATCLHITGRVARRFAGTSSGGMSHQIQPATGRAPLRRCGWCSGPLQDRPRRDSACCSNRCRHARRHHRWRAASASPRLAKGAA